METERADTQRSSAGAPPARNVGDSPVLSGRCIPWGYVLSLTVLSLTSTSGPTSGNAYVLQRPLLPGLSRAKLHLIIWLPRLPPLSWVDLKGKDGFTMTGNSAVVPASTHPGGILLFAHQSPQGLQSWGCVNGVCWRNSETALAKYKRSKSLNSLRLPTLTHLSESSCREPIKNWEIWFSLFAFLPLHASLFYFIQ